MTRIIGLVLCTVVACFSLPALAEIEDGLYGAALPNDAAFLRRVGTTDGAMTILGRSFLADELPEATYTAISAAELDGAEAGDHYTIIVNENGLTTLREPARTDPSKVYLFLLNTDVDTACVVVADGGPTVIDDTAQGHIVERAVNPIAVSLTVEAEALSQDFDLVLRRGVNLTFLVADGAVQLIENRFGPVIEAN